MVTDHNLNMRFAENPRAGIGRDPFLKNSAHGLETDAQFLLNSRDGPIQHRAIQLATNQIPVLPVRRRVLGDGNALPGQGLLERRVKGGEHFREADVQQVETNAEMDMSPENGRFFDPVRAQLGKAGGPIQRSLRAVFLKVDARSKPVVIVLARLETGATQQPLFRDGAVAAVIADDGALVEQRLHSTSGLESPGERKVGANLRTGAFRPTAFRECGLPLELCVDFHSCFFTHVPDACTQLGQARYFYGVSFRYAPTPQAKGKIEREHQFWQNRRPSFSASENIADLAHANPHITDLRHHRNHRELHRELQMKPQQAWDTSKKKNVPCCGPSHAVRGGPSSGASAPASKPATRVASRSAPSGSASPVHPKPNSSSVITPRATPRFWPPNPIRRPNRKFASPTGPNNLSRFANSKPRFLSGFENYTPKTLAK